jgi:phenylacetate-CoA ligase
VPASAWALYRASRNLQRRPEAVADDQLRRLRAAVEHASRTVQIYQELYPEGVADQLERWEDIRRLPILDKSVIHSRSEADRRSGVAPEGTRVTHSSGTTGQPLRVEYSPAAAWWHGVLALRMVWARGVRPWERVAAVALGHVPAAPTGLAKRLRRSRALPVGATHEELVANLLEFRPVMLGGASRVLIEVGERLGSRLPIRVVATFGEVVPPEHRAALAELYGSEPVDSYGTAEHGHVAWQCRAVDLYHINHEAVLVEILDDRDQRVAPGETGHLVLTGLWNPLMPFLRYRVGDTAALADRPCACGSVLPALDRVDGRALDWLVDTDGRRIAPQRLWLSEHCSSDEFSAVERYRIRQDSSGALTIELKLRRHLWDGAIKELRTSYGRLLGPGVPIEVHVRERLDPEPSGKFRIIASACRSDRPLTRPRR